MSDCHLVDPQGWEYDLQSVYSAYMGYFQLHRIPWHDRTWCHYFETFEQFLAFTWPVVTVTDARTGRAHIVTRMSSVTAFLKMIKTRFGETLPQVDNMLLISPLETSQRRTWHVNEWLAYKKLHSTLPAVALAAFKARVRVGDPSAIRELWAMRDKTFLAIDFECIDRNDHSCVEWGYAVIRCSYLEAAGAWPPVPDKNYRKGHYIISEYTDMVNKASPTVPWQYAFGESQVVAKAKLPRIIQSILSLVSPDSEAVANDVVLIAHGVQAVLQHLQDMKIKLPNNVLMLDVAYLERALFNTGERGPMLNPKTGKSRLPESLLSLGGILHSFKIEPPCVLHNAGNDAFMTLVVFQRMVDPKGGVGVAAGMMAALGAGMAAGNGNGTGKGEKQNGDGHIKRAATVAARFFRPRPLGNSALTAHVDLDKNGSGQGQKQGDGSRMRVGGHGAGADEMGVRVSAKRASMFSALTLMSPRLMPTDKEAGNGGTDKGGGRAGAEGGDGWRSPPTLRPNQRRYSTIVERRR